MPVTHSRCNHSIDFGSVSVSSLFEFEDGSANATGNSWDSMSTDFYSGDESLAIFDGGGDKIPFIAGNSSGLIALGKFLIQMGMSDYWMAFTSISMRTSTQTNQKFSSLV